MTPFLKHSLKIYNKIQYAFFVILLATLSITLCYCSFISEGLIEPGDGVNHYYISKYAPLYPKLYLDHWGKPLFTLLSSPFSQIGFPGLIIFNILLFCITSILIFSWARIENNGFAWLTPLLLFSSNVYFTMVNAGMTEILFATILTITVYLFLKEKFIIGSIIFSFSIFSRPEGNLILPIFFVFLIYKKQWKSIPFLASGFLIYSIIGFFHFKDILWVINNNPYPHKVPFYGHGKIFDFINSNQAIWGPFMTILSPAGVFCIIYSFFWEKKKQYDFTYIFLLILPSAVVLIVHSYIWWKGIHGSLGLTRVMATVVPLFVILSLIFLKQFQQVAAKIIREKNVPLLLSISTTAIALIMIATNIGWKQIPVKESEMQKLTTKSANYYTSLNSSDKICFTHPYFGFKTNLNPFDTDKIISPYLLDKENPAKNFTAGNYIVWESHFGPNDFNVSRQTLVNCANIDVEQVFQSDIGFSKDAKPYEIIIARVK